MSTGSRRARWDASVDLALALVWRELAVRYKRSVLGVMWALVEPLANVAIYVLVFGFVLGARETVESYPVFTVFGVLPWLFLSTTVDQASGVLLEHAPLIRKVAFRRELLVFAVVFSRLTTLLLGLAMAFLWAGLWTFRGAALQWHSAALIPLGLLLIVIATTGLSLCVSALQVVLRDTGFLVRFGLRLFFYACPVIYPVSRVPDVVRPWYELNPLVGVIGCFHGIATFDGAPSQRALMSAIFGSLLAGLAGWWCFKRLQSVVSDLV